MKENNIKKLIAAVAVAIVAGLGIGTAAIINNQDGSTEVKLETTIEPANIEYADEQVPAVITEETGQGAVETEITEIDGQEIPTIESVEAPGPVTEEYEAECPEGEECGRGAVYPQLDISNPQAFTNAVLNKCIDVDGYYGAQCWDLASAFHHQYTGRVLTTCGTGAAKGVIADGCWQQNNLGEYITTWNYNDIIAGTVVFFGGGQWGHVGIALGPVHNGYVTLLGQNQGGGWCPGGGSAANIINISVKDFIGAFIPTIYIPPTPAPEPEPEPTNTCEAREVQPGDTLGAIMQECRGEIEWGEPMNDYARSWTAEETGNTVFYGWTHDTGYGLIAGQTIRYEGK